MKNLLVKLIYCVPSRFYNKFLKRDKKHTILLFECDLTKLSVGLLAHKSHWLFVAMNEASDR